MRIAPPVSPVMQRLSAYIAQALRKPLPRDVAEKTKHHLLDTIAAMVSGSRLPPGKKATSFVRTLGGAKEACVAGSRIVTAAANAALANGMLAHADETDDSHAPSLTHPGCGIVPAALAMAERERRNGTALLRAVALGYDVGCRLTQSLDAYQFREDGHSTHSFGPMFGAAAAAGALAGLERAPGAAPSLVHRAAGLGHLVLDARRGARREGFRFRRHAGAQRRGRGPDGRPRLHRRRGRVCRRAQLLRRLRPRARPRGAGRGAWARAARS